MINHRRKTTSQFLEEIKDVVSNSNLDFSKGVYETALVKFKVVCPVHGEKFILPNKLKAGRGCNECADKNLSKRFRLPMYEVVKRIQEVYQGNYKILPFEYINNHTKVSFVCKNHGVFEKTLSHVWDRKQGCPKCSFEEAAKKGSKTKEFFVNEANEIHNHRYSYDNLEYKGMVFKGLITCKEHGDFEVLLGNHIYNKSGCSKCSHVQSLSELEVVSHLESLGLIVEYQKNLIGKYSLDAFIPSLQLGIEYNGLYFHGEKMREKDSHLFKFMECKRQGIDLVQIFEDEWTFKKDLVKHLLVEKMEVSSREPSTFGNITSSIVDGDTAMEFLNKFHIKGRPLSRGYSENGVFIGSFVNTDLVGVLSFSEVGPSRYLLNRFYGRNEFKPMFKFFLSNFEVEEILYFSDNRFSSEKFMIENGFSKERDIKPSYSWCKGNKRFHRSTLSKEFLIENFGGYKEGLSLQDNCREKGFYKIWDAGKTEMIFKK